ncbi:MAG: hypothetical protein HGB12_12530 [Bacteroidetes bacterium]|nr:hypothetical protein [Bacteroidota bacterium]
MSFHVGNNNFNEVVGAGVGTLAEMTHTVSINVANMLSTDIVVLQMINGWCLTAGATLSVLSTADGSFTITTTYNEEPSGGDLAFYYIVTRPK